MWGGGGLQLGRFLLEVHAAWPGLDHVTAPAATMANTSSSSSRACLFDQQGQEVRANSNPRQRSLKRPLKYDQPPRQQAQSESLVFTCTACSGYYRSHSISGHLHRTDQPLPSIISGPILGDFSWPAAADSLPWPRKPGRSPWEHPLGCLAAGKMAPLSRVPLSQQPSNPRELSWVNCLHCSPS